MMDCLEKAVDLMVKAILCSGARQGEPDAIFPSKDPSGTRNIDDILDASVLFIVTVSYGDLLVCKE